MISHEFILISDDFTWFHMSSYDFTWVHMSSFDFTWVHMISAHPSRQNGDFSPKKSWIFGGIFRGHWTCAQPQSASGGKKTSSSSSGRCGKASTETIGKHCRKGMPGRLFSICGWWILQMKCVNLKDIWAAKFMLVCPTWDSCRLVPCRCALPTHTPVLQVKSAGGGKPCGSGGKATCTGTELCKTWSHLSVATPLAKWSKWETFPGDTKRSVFALLHCIVHACQSLYELLNLRRLQVAWKRRLSVLPPFRHSRQKIRTKFLFCKVSLKCTRKHMEYGV